MAVYFASLMIPAVSPGLNLNDDITKHGLSNVYVRIGILLTYEKHLPTHFTETRGLGPWNPTSLTPPFTYRSAHSKPGDWVVVYIRVRGIDVSCVYDYPIRFWTTLNVVFFVFNLMNPPWLTDFCIMSNISFGEVVSGPVYGQCKIKLSV
jgi:hypothetical protein